MKLPVPLNYFDYLRRRCSSLFPYIEKEVGQLREKGALGPFYNSDFYAAYIEEYLRLEGKALLQHMYDTLSLQYGRNRAIEMVEEFKKSQEADQTVTALEWNYTAAVNFELHGKKTFFITPNLYEHLAQTSIDTNSELARLPFPSCLFVYDSLQSIELLYRINNDRPLSYSGTISVFASEVSQNNERVILLHIIHSDMNAVHYALKRQLLMRESWTLEQSLRTEWDKILPAETEGRSDFNISDEKFYTSGLTFFRAIVNTILYISSSDPDLTEQLSPYPQIVERLAKAKSRDKRKDIKSEMKRVSQTNYIIVGRDIPKLLPSEPNDTFQKRCELNVRFVVRGHWRNQVCGPGNSSRRLVWVKPYYKGPEISNVIKNRPYVVV